MKDVEEMLKIIGEFKTSMKSQRAFCSERNLKRSTLRYWMGRAEQLEIGDKITFAQLIVEDYTC